MGLLGKQWKYISEGNVHIVVEIVGTSDVVRLIKEDGESTDYNMVCNSVNFVNLVMIPLLSNIENKVQEVIEITTEEMTELNRELVVFRPEHRRKKSVLSRYAIRTENLTILSPKCVKNFCVEIKPKKGYLASSLKKYSKCYYCLKQHLKLNENLISQTSTYCPLDLFSGETERMKQALLSLVNNPQNNLKIFQNGCLIFDEKSPQNAFDDIATNIFMFTSANQFLDFIIETLLSGNSKSTTVLTESKEVTIPVEKHNCTENNKLNTNTFLYNLLHLQKLSESLNYDPDATENLEYVPVIIKQLINNKLDLKIETDREKFMKTCDPNHLALISAVFKDCSIMIQFTNDFKDGHSALQVGDRIIPFRVSVTDLEPKPGKTLAKRIKTERKLVSICEKIVGLSDSHGEYTRRRNPLK